MPKRTDLKSIMIIGAGPIVIGQACEFDYSGAQACKALKEEGYRVILVNNNPATIMTDPEMADATYIEPLTIRSLEQIISKEKPDALLSTMGGQTALNISIELKTQGILKNYNVELIGATEKVIEKAENRELFKKSMKKINLETPRGYIVKSIKEAKKALEEISFPIILRPSFTLGGSGGGVAKNKKEFIDILNKGLSLSPIKEVLIEESVIGWKEYEMEVVRDKNDNCIIVCSIENIDPMGVHTGDSMTVAPALTLTDKEFQKMRIDSIKVLKEIGVETGGSNVQFAVNPKNGKSIVIEMNPRVSRSSALASKATGFPIARVATKLAVGYTLDELKNDITQSTPASFEPTIDYIVTKIPRFTFEKFNKTQPILGTAMKSIGECMAIGRNFKESFQKAIRSLEIGLCGLEVPSEYKNKSKKELINILKIECPYKFLLISHSLRKGISVKKICELTNYDLWFVTQISELIETERLMINTEINHKIYKELKEDGFSDKRIVQLSSASKKRINLLKKKYKIKPSYRTIDTCAAEFPSKTPYMYSSYTNLETSSYFEEETKVSKNKKVIILGGGPNRIGQGIEFDYCCVHAAYALKEMKIESIMVNCNPETVSTDFDTSDRLYFEPLDEESVLEICKAEKSNGKLLGVIVQLGGQTPLKLSKMLIENNIKILGTPYDSIDLAEDRERFKSLVNDLSLNQPQNSVVYSRNEAKKSLKKINFPVVVRPSYVLGGRAMRIINDSHELDDYFKTETIQAKSAILIDKFLNDAKEIDVDAISDGKDVFIAGILEHIEEAGIHSGDSACSLPPQTLSKKSINYINNATTKIAKKLKVKGCINIQYAVKDNKVFLIEVNPRASRTIPFIAKSLGIPIAKIATKVMLGENLKKFVLQKKSKPHITVKESVFPFDRFPGEDIILGPEMKSTGEVMGIDNNFPMAFLKSQISSGNKLPKKGNVFISVKDEDKEHIILMSQILMKLNFKLIGTKGTVDFLKKYSIKISLVHKVGEGHPHIVDYIEKNKINLIINTTQDRQSIKDSKSIRKAAIRFKVPYVTTISAAKLCITSINVLNNQELKVKSLQEYYK